MTEEYYMMSYFGQRFHQFHFCLNSSTFRSISSSTPGLRIRRHDFDVHCRLKTFCNDRSLASSCGLLKRVGE